MGTDLRRRLCKQGLRLIRRGGVLPISRVSYMYPKAAHAPGTYCTYVVTHACRVHVAHQVLACPPAG